MPDSITSVKEIRRTPAQERADGTYTAQRDFEVIADGYDVSIDAILAHADIPARGAAHPELTAATVRSRGVDEFAEGIDNVWRVTIDYDSQAEANDSNPSDNIVEGGQRTATKAVPAFFDALGYPLANTAGDPYEGLTRNKSIRVYDVEAKFTTIPDYLFSLAGTLNDANISIHGRTFPAGTALLASVSHPKRRERSPNGTEYWPISYEIQIDPDGWWILLPNSGSNELQYQTADDDGNFDQSTYAVYSAADAADRRVIKAPISNELAQVLGQKPWLDRYGRAVKVKDLTSSTIGTGTMTAGSATLTLGAAGFETDAEVPDDVGLLVRVDGAGYGGRPLWTRISAVTSTTVATLEDTAKTAVSGVNVYAAGAYFNRFELPYRASWSSVPLPNNHS